MSDDESTERDRAALDAANWVIGAAHRAGLHGLRRDVADAIVTELAGHPALRAQVIAYREALAASIVDATALRAQVAAVEALCRRVENGEEGLIVLTPVQVRRALASQPTPAAESGVQS